MKEAKSIFEVYKVSKRSLTLELDPENSQIKMGQIVFELELKVNEARDMVEQMLPKGILNLEAAFIAKQVNITEVHMLKSTDNGLRKDKFLKVRDKLSTLLHENAPEIRLGTPELQAKF